MTAARSWLQPFKAIALAALLTGGCVAVPAAARAQDAPAVGAAAAGVPAPSPQQVIEEAADEYAAIDAALDRTSDEAGLRELNDRILVVEKNAADAAKALAPDLAQLDARLQQLGPVVAGTPEPTDIAAQRKAITRERGAVDGSVRRGKLLAVEARQLREAIEKARAERFSAQLSKRVAPPLSPALWQQIASDFPADLSRLSSLTRIARGGVAAAIATRGWGFLVFAAVLALLLLLPVRMGLRWLGKRYAIAQAPGSRLRRSGLALWFLLVGTLTPGFAGLVAIETLRWAGAVPTRLEPVATGLVLATFIGAFIGSLGASLLLPGQPSWRLLPIDDGTAVRLRKYAWLTALMSFASILLLQVNAASHTSNAATVAADGAIALAHAVLIIAVVASLRRMHKREVRADEEATATAMAAGNTPPTPRTRGNVMLLLTLVVQVLVVFAVGAALFGYLGIALFVLQQIVWCTVVVAATTLFMMFCDDFATWLFAGGNRIGRASQAAFGLRPSRLDQAGVLLSAALRVCVLLLGLGALLAPYGSNLSGFFGWFDTASQGIKLGEFTLEPGKIVRAALVLVLSLALMQGIHGWLVNRYLPKTELDDGSRNSVSTVARYIGILLACVWALASLGIGLEKVALVLSALSVGIGFGLQAITQNFVSGLILLAERPLKIGDWVKIGDQEGDVKRISVRATEIQVSDKSTLIVPNSELVTKIVRNMTMANPIGRVQIQFAVPLQANVAQVRELVLGLFRHHSGVLPEPAPAVFIDSIAAGQVTFNCFAHVSGPRAAYGVRSELFFQLIEALAEAGIELSTPTEVHITGGSDLPAPPPGVVREP